jgi:Mn2+/Fe2+ NRAMP family transporter
MSLDKEITVWEKFFILVFTFIAVFVYNKPFEVLFWVIVVYFIIYPSFEKDIKVIWRKIK